MLVVVDRESGMSQVRLPELDPLDVKGNLEIVGSATVTPVIQQLYKRFILEVYRGLIKLRSVGTQRGFSHFCQEGKADIVMASRPIKATEISACAAQERTPVKVVGWDNRSSSFWPRSSDHFDHFGKHQSGIYMPQGPEFIRCDYPNPLPPLNSTLAWIC
ncbi:hypothetical protein C2W62_36540 [Candidatus Entotheonella serta]|nr:hypothetical protein C2W62_36540 [Candidatus Entotheonella serta]